MYENVSNVSVIRHQIQTLSVFYKLRAASIDSLVQTDENGFQWILIAADVASRWVEIFPLQEATAEACAKILIDEMFLRYGLPRRLKCDNGVQFISAVM